MSGMQSLIGFFLGNARPSSQDTVVHVKRTVLAVAWLAINQSVSEMWRCTSHISADVALSWIRLRRHNEAGHIDFGMGQTLGSLPSSGGEPNKRCA